MGFWNVLLLEPGENSKIGFNTSNFPEIKIESGLRPRNDEAVLHFAQQAKNALTFLILFIWMEKHKNNLMDL